MLDVTRAWGLNFLFPAGDTAVGRALREHGEFARPEVDLICEMARGPVVDVGANIGAISLPIAARRPELRVVAAEAHRGLAGLLAANAYSNHLLNVDVHHAAVGAQDGVVPFATAPLHEVTNFGEHSLATEAKAPAEPVRMTTLDALAPPDVSFVKIDVEGFEPQVLAGAEETLASRRPAWLIEASADRQPAAREVFEILRRHGYCLHWFFSPFSTPRRTKPKFHQEPLRGDVGVLATEGDPPWAMRPVGDAWPSDVSDFPYLNAYSLVSRRPSIDT
jgi:FkbM family methyltransferase